MSGRRMLLYGAQNLGQLGRAEFAGSAGPVAISGETCHGARLSEPGPGGTMSAEVGRGPGSNDSAHQDTRGVFHYHQELLVTIGPTETDQCRCCPAGPRPKVGGSKGT